MELVVRPNLNQSLWPKGGKALIGKPEPGLAGVIPFLSRRLRAGNGVSLGEIRALPYKQGVSGVKTSHCLHLSFIASSLLEEGGIPAAATWRVLAVAEKIPAEVGAPAGALCAILSLKCDK